jgi:hypothetical protein
MYEINPGPGYTNNRETISSERTWKNLITKNFDEKRTNLLKSLKKMIFKERFAND